MQKLNEDQKELAKNNIRLVGFALKKMGIERNAENYADLCGSGYLGLCLAALKWHEGGAAFSGFAYRSIKCEILRTIKSEQKQKASTVCEDYVESLSDIEKSELRVLYEQFLQNCDKLTNDQKAIFSAFVSGNDTRKTAKLLGITVSAVLKNKSRACDEFKKFAADLKDKS